jgi:hypothetical protein
VPARRHVQWIAAAFAGAAMLTIGVSSAPGREADSCGVPDAGTVWFDYGEGPVRPDTRAVLARPGVVVATSGGPVPRYFRTHGAATAYFVLHLPNIVGQPAKPADPASIPAAADALFAKAVASSACATPWIGLNELFGSALPTPWSATNAQYRANVLALMQGLAAHGARPVLFVSGSPNVAGDAVGWWQQVAQTGAIVYEAYYDAKRAASLGSLLGSRRMRLGIRSTIALFQGIGITPDRLGIALGFHSGGGQGAGGRQGLQPREAWLRVVKWEALAAKQVAADTKIGSVWSWGWGTFGPASVDPDKPAAACVYLWTRDSSLCDGRAAAGPGFHASLVEGQIVLPAPILCGLSGGRRIPAADVTRLTVLTHDRHAAIDALFARLVLRSAVTITNAQVLAVEKQAIARGFGGDRAAYLNALSQAGATLGVAQNVIRDELRRRAIVAKLAGNGSTQPPLQWMADRTAQAVNFTICRKDDLPGSGDFPRSDTRDVGVVPLPGLLPFLFDDHTAPAAPAAPAATAAPATVSLAWPYGTEPDLAGYEVFRAPTAGGPYTKLTTSLLDRPAFTDRAAPPGVPSFYVVRAVDSSGNESGPSPEISAAPA